MFLKIKEFLNKKQNERLTDDFKNAVNSIKAVNIAVTLTVLKNYLVQEQLARTGLLYSRDDNYIVFKARKLFWEWKKEGIINEFEDFEETTKSWIMAFAT